MNTYGINTRIYCVEHKIPGYALLENTARRTPTGSKDGRNLAAKKEETWGKEVVNKLKIPVT